MSVDHLLRLETETVTEMPIKIPFEFNSKGAVPQGKDPGDCIVIRPITVQTWFRLRPLLLQIDSKDLDRMTVKAGELAEGFSELMDKYGGLLLDIVCIGIHNKPSEPPTWFREVLMDNSTWEDIRILLNAVLYRIGYFPFCTSITTLRNVSPIGETEIIAAQKNLESWQTLTKQDF